MAVRTVNGSSIIRLLPPFTAVSCCAGGYKPVQFNCPTRLPIMLKPIPGFRLELKSSEEALENKLGKQTLQKGLLLEFRKDTDRVLLAVVQKPDGKKNWMVTDQNGVVSSIKPQQVTFVVPGIEDFDHNEIPQFLQKVQDNL
ncbi:hypothetical protein M569_07188, partial [Genlisea aurea]